MLTINERAWPALAALLETPAEELGSLIAEAIEMLDAAEPAVAASLREFGEETAALDLGRLQEIHISTFDLSPSCVPYAGIHLFGEENRQRAKLLTGLDERYRAAAFDRGGELPDHLALLLAFAPRFEAAEWRDLGRFVLVPALAAMKKSFEGGKNPYRHLIGAVEAAVAFELAGEECHV